MLPRFVRLWSHLASTITQLIIPEESAEGDRGTDGPLGDDPLVDMAYRDPVVALRFIKAAMLLGSASSAAVAIVSLILLSCFWSHWGRCERPLRWWLLFNSLLQLCQVPLRLVFFARAQDIESSGQNIVRRISNLAGSGAWQSSKMVSLLTYFWLILGFVWTINTGNCSDCAWLCSTTAAMLALSSARVLCAFASFRFFLPQDAQPEQPRVAAAAPSQINALPTLVFRSDDDSTHGNTSCAVCLSDYREGDVLRDFPCGHQFHRRCADQWLARNKRCPLCMRAIDEVDRNSSCPCRKRLKGN